MKRKLDKKYEYQDGLVPPKKTKKPIRKVVKCWIILHEGLPNYIDTEMTRKEMETWYANQLNEGQKLVRAVITFEVPRNKRAV